MNSNTVKTMTDVKPKTTRYVLVFGERYYAYENEHNYIITAYPYNEYRRVKSGESNALVFILDEDDWEQLQNLNKRIRFIDGDIYPSYRENKKTFTILERLYDYNPDKYIYIFKNGNNRDLRKENVTCCPPIHKELIGKHNIVEYIQGHTKTIGQQSGIMKNPLWKIIENGKEYLLMYCEKDTLCKLCLKSYQKILDFEKEKNNGKKITFFKHSNGYISSHIGTSSLFIHQIITNCYGNGKGTSTISVDHIDRNPLNNTFDNLRIATQEEQHKNTKGQIEGTKKARYKNARSLPEGITEDMLPKYITYAESTYGTEGKLRSYFCISNHPNQYSNIYTSKSNKVSILEKLEEAKRIVAELDKRKITDVNEVKPKKEVEENYTLPQYFHMTKQHGKDAVCFERRYDGGKRRVGIKVTIKKGETIQQAVERIMEQVNIETGEKKKTPKEVGGVTLSKGFSFSKSDGKDCISFQRNISGKRYVGKTIVGEGETIADTIERLKTNIKKRYELEDNILFSG
jgi:hypothetical protein